jgi:hypothetical protein
MFGKKKVIIVFFGVLVGVSGVAIYLAKTNGVNVSKKAIRPSTPTPTPVIDLDTWTDQTGFTFQYPKGLSVNKHDEDTTNYAHVELTAASHPGSVIVWAKDTSWADIDKWVKGDTRLSGAIIADTTLGSQQGKKALLAGPPQQRIVGTISDNILFTVEGTLTDTEYWSGIEETVANSFAFSKDANGNTITHGAGDSSENASAAIDNTGDGDGPVDETEIVE